MSDSPTPRDGRRWLAAASVAGLAVAIAGFGGLVLPRMASEGIPPTFRAKPNDPVVVKYQPRHQCKELDAGRAATRPVFVSPADR